MKTASVCFLVSAVAIAIGGCSSGCCSRAGDVRIMSYNVYHCVGSDKKLDIDRTASVIARERPDFVGLQEIDCVTKRSLGLDEAKELGKRLGMHSVFAKALDFQGGGYGIAVLSREKPLSFERVALPGREPRMLLICEFEKCYFACTHLSLQATNRLASVEIVRREIAERKGAKPFFLVGDWNAKPESKELAEVRKFMTILSKQDCRTFHGFKPYKAGSKCCIDYIAADSGNSAKYAVKESYVIEDKLTSDHFPVVVALGEK